MRDYIITFLTAGALLGGYWIAGMAGMAVIGLLTAGIAAAMLLVALGQIDELRREIEVGENKRRMLVYQVDDLRRDCRFLRSRLAVQHPPIPECPEEEEDDEDEEEEPQGVRELAEE